MGVFKDFGAIANYAHEIEMSAKSSLAFGFNVIYSRRGLNLDAITTQDADPFFTDDLGFTTNFQDIPVVNLQPAVTFSYSNFEIGLFAENLADFNLKASEMVTEFADKTFTGHIGFSKQLLNANGLLEDTNIRVFGVARKATEFTYGGNFLVDLPKVGWIKGGYDSFYGINAGIGVNISERLSVGFAYETNDNLGSTNEIGLSYVLGKTRRKYSQTKPKISVIIPNDKEEKPVPVRSEVEKDEEEDRYKTPDSEYNLSLIHI